MSRSRRPRPANPLVVTSGDTCFTYSADSGIAAPPPYEAAARTSLLLEAAAPTVLILGYGLGAMGSRISHLRPSANILGIEPNADYVRVAGERAPTNVSIRHDDALAFLRRTRRRFDLVIDDCFSLQSGDVRRPEGLDMVAELVARRVSATGIAVQNVLPDDTMGVAAELEEFSRFYETVETRRFREWENILVIGTNRPLPLGWRRRLA